MPFHADKAYSYYVPFGFFGEIIRGNLVVVPFGGANKRLTALVTAVSDTNDIENLKPILSVNDYVKLTNEEVDLSEFIAKYSFCSIGEAVKAILPPGILTDVTCVYKLSEIAVEEPISEDAYRIMNLLYKRGELTTLSHDTLSIVPQKANNYVIYADVCTIGKEQLAKLNISFKKIPRDINRF